MQPHQSGITLENIDLTLGSNASRVHVLNDISLKIQRGESVGIVGPSGSGKSTLLMVLAGLEKVDSGKVLISGEQIDQMSEDQAAAFRGRNIGIVFQSFHLIPNMTALENVAVPLELAGRDDAFAVAEQALKSVGLGHRLSHYPSALSGGEQQRVAIARAFLADAPVLILDEATSSLDSESEVLIQQAMERLMVGRTTLVIAHRLSTVRALDRLLVFDRGRIVEEGDHDALIRKSDGIYRRLFERQALELTKGLEDVILS